MQEDPDRLGESDVQVINEARRNYQDVLSRYIAAANRDPQLFQEMTGELQAAVFIYYSRLRAKIKNDLSEFWNDKTIIEVEGRASQRLIVEGFNEVDEYLEPEQMIGEYTTSEKNRFTGDVEKEHHLEPRILPPKILLAIGDALEEAYDRLGLGVRVRPEWSETETGLQDAQDFNDELRNDLEGEVDFL